MLRSKMPLEIFWLLTIVTIIFLPVSGCSHEIIEADISSQLFLQLNDIHFNRGPITQPQLPGETISLKLTLLPPTEIEYQKKQTTWFWLKDGTPLKTAEGNSLEFTVGPQPVKITAGHQTSWKAPGERRKLVQNHQSIDIHLAPAVRRKPDQSAINGFEIGHLPDASGRHCIYQNQLLVTNAGYSYYRSTTGDSPLGTVFFGQLLNPLVDQTGALQINNQHIAIEINDITGWLPEQAVLNPNSIRLHPHQYDQPEWFYPVTAENRTGYVIPGLRWEQFDHDSYVRQTEDSSITRYIPVERRLITELNDLREKLLEQNLPHQLTLLAGSRNPAYNLAGIGQPGNLKAIFSRHQYGDAVDLIVDSTGDGRLDDLTGDGQITVEDAKILAETIRTIRRESGIQGGIGLYDHHDVKNRIQTPYLHIDQRGFPASWTVLK